MVYVVALFEEYDGHNAPCIAFFEKEDAIKWCKSQDVPDLIGTEAGYYVYEVPVYPEAAAVGWGLDRKVWPE
jgi:hypothetical protein